MKYFLVLALCSIAAFVAVLRMRPEIFSGTYSSARTTTSMPPPIIPEKKNTNAAARTRSVRAEKDVEPRPVSLLPEVKPNTTPSANPLARRFVRATVTSDTLPVYATNSPKSRVLKVLNRGDLVQTDLAVIDSVGHWSLITVPGQRISGYVRTEDIDMTRTASED